MRKWRSTFGKVRTRSHITLLHNLFYTCVRGRSRQRGHGVGVLWWDQVEKYLAGARDTEVEEADEDRVEE